MFVSFQNIAAKSDDINENRRRDVYWHLYYLLGYVMEGITVYSAYKLHEWPEEQDIQFWSSDRDVMAQMRHFTESTHLDFYNVRVDPRTKRNVFRDNVVFYSIENHNFQRIVHGLLKMNPALEGVPYLGDGEIDEDVRELIDIWNPRVRYFQGRQDVIKHHLNQSDNIKKLITTCIDIYSKAYKI